MTRLRELSEFREEVIEERDMLSSSTSMRKRAEEARNMPSEVVMSTSTVGLPRESMTSRPKMPVICDAMERCAVAAGARLAERAALAMGAARRIAIFMGAVRKDPIETTQEGVRFSRWRRNLIRSHTTTR